MDFYLEVEVQPEFERFPVFWVQYPCRGGRGRGRGRCVYHQGWKDASAVATLGAAWGEDMMVVVLWSKPLTKVAFYTSRVECGKY